MQTVVRGFVTAVLAVFLVGFGVCGAYGSLVGIGALLENSSEGRAFAPVFVIAGLIGLALAWGCWKAIAGIRRKPAPPAE